MFAGKQDLFFHFKLKVEDLNLLRFSLKASVNIQCSFASHVNVSHYKDVSAEKQDFKRVFRSGYEENDSAQETKQTSRLQVNVLHYFLPVWQKNVPSLRQVVSAHFPFA